jgi:hypothetical protein
MLKKTTLAFLCSLIGVVFIFSGYAKLYPVEPFEFTFVDIGIVNWELAPFIARALIGFEFFVGFFFLFNISLRKIAYKLGSLVLILFSIYLLLLILLTGNTGNCGCFGTMLEMTPFQALIKNLMMLIVIYFLNIQHKGWTFSKYPNVLNTTLFISLFTMPFILNPIELDYSEAYLNKPTKNFKLELDTLYTNAKLNIPPQKLSKGKHIIAFMSLTCSHCKIAAKKMSVIYKRNSAISFYFVLNGKRENLTPFFEETHSSKIPYCMLPGRPFVYLAGTTWPTIYLVNNSVVEHEINYLNMDEKEIEKWMKN